MRHRIFYRHPVFTAHLAICLLLAWGGIAQAEVFRIGMIGLDTSHVTAFTRQINDPKNDYGCKVVAGFPGGSPDVTASATRVDRFTKELRETHGLDIVDSIEALCQRVDGIMLESVDGRPHLAQVKPAIAAGLPVFIDKPMAGSLADVIEIFRLAEQAKVPCWSSSSLRYALGIAELKAAGSLGDILGCEVYSPCSFEPHHPDLYWYGVHGVEILYTIMGTGCETVTRTHTADTDVVVGRWKDGRIATYRGIRKGKSGYAARIFGSKSIQSTGKYGGYMPLVEEIVRFFKTGEVPVPAEETIELFTFMSAADASKLAGGAPVSLAAVLAEANKP